MIKYLYSKDIKTEDVCRVFSLSGIRRPVEDIGRINRMIENSDIVITAWDEGKMIAVARAITDYSYCCYLSDLAVDKAYQKQGIGKELVNRIRAMLGEEVSLVLLSAPEAMDYYPKLGFNNTDKAFVIGRKR